MIKYKWTLTIEVEAEDRTEAEERLSEKMDEYMHIMAYDGLLGCGKLEEEEK